MATQTKGHFRLLEAKSLFKAGWCYSQLARQYNHPEYKIRRWLKYFFEKNGADFEFVLKLHKKRCKICSKTIHRFKPKIKLKDTICSVCNGKGGTHYTKDGEMIVSPLAKCIRNYTREEIQKSWFYLNQVT